jgi:hypothetical protein
MSRRAGGAGSSLHGAGRMRSARRGPPDRKRLRHPAFADERHAHDATGRLWRLRAAVPLHFPARGFISAGRTEQGHAAVLEVKQRIVAVQGTDQLPDLVRYSRDDAGRFCVLLRTTHRHCRVPLLKPHQVGRAVAPPRSSHRTTARHFKSSAIRTAGPLRFWRSNVNGWEPGAVCGNDRAHCPREWMEKHRSLVSAVLSENAATAGGEQLSRDRGQIAGEPQPYRSLRMARITKPTFAGRSPSRRMKYGNHWRPNGT